MDKWDKGEIEDDIRCMDKLLGMDFFSAKNAENPLFRAGFIEALIALRDLMAERRQGERNVRGRIEARLLGVHEPHGRP